LERILGEGGLRLPATNLNSSPHGVAVDADGVRRAEGIAMAQACMTMAVRYRGAWTDEISTLWMA
jgi:hypothetical protein